MKTILILILTTVTFSQEVTRYNSFAALNNINLRNTIIAWEIDQQTEESGSHYSNYTFYTDDEANGDLFDLYEITSKAGTNVFVIGFGKSKTDIDMVVSSNSEDLEIKVSGKIIWLGKQDVRKSYDFVKALGKEANDDVRAYFLLNDHAYDEETLAFYKEKYAAADRRKEKEKLIFYIADIPSDIGIRYLDELYMMERSDRLKEKIIFGYSHNKSELGLKRLLFVAKHDSDLDLRKKALFWVGQRAGKEMEKYFSDIVFSDDEMEIKESAVFALYNMESEDQLKKVVSSSKDIRLRKKALFWLGQMGAGVEYFESILKKN